jgi:hypothetical protein
MNTPSKKKERLTAEQKAIIERELIQALTACERESWKEMFKRYFE